MSSTQKFIFYSTLLGLFSAKLSFGLGSIHLLVFYFFLMLNLGILASAGCVWIPRKLAFFLLYLLISGLLGIASGSGSFVGFAKDYMGILPCAIYYPSFLRSFGFDIRRPFALYAQLAFYAAIFGLLYLPIQAFPAGRLKSIALEPSGYALIVLPATYYYTEIWHRTGKHKLRSLVLIISILLSRSTLGLFGLLFGGYLLGARHRFGKLVAPLVLCALTTAAFFFSDAFQLKMTNAVLGTSHGEIATIDQSTYGSVISFFITARALEDHPLLGGGLGSFVTSHEKYFGLIPGTEFILDEGRLFLGQWDASSLLLRIAAELGIVGLLGAAWFLWSFYPKRGSPEERAIAGSVLCYVVGKFVRDGAYFNPEVFFFFSCYAINGLLSKERIRKQTVGSLISPTRRRQTHVLAEVHGTQ